ncbi:unnamed protein product [Oncorhynchus mykiss]|uniref:Uncharacterized protein n=1 Tax=Oncorhynchus mykiss TaxID=8022 RepID=A0A060Z0T6_ONCMY|nr:unnamed protein product [Oncorhynchus mykiss]
MAKHNSNTIIKFADNTTVVGLITGDDELAYREEVRDLARWCQDNTLLHGLHTHQTCHPLSMCGMLWIDVYDSVFQFPPISSNFAQPLKRSGTTFHRIQSTAC